MSTIEIRDYALWPQHLEGNDALKERLLGLPKGQIVILKIAGKSGAWVRMDQGKNPAPTPGLKPACDTTREWWHAMRSRRGERVSIAEVTP